VSQSPSGRQRSAETTQLVSPQRRTAGDPAQTLDDRAPGRGAAHDARQRTPRSPRPSSAASSRRSLTA